MIEYTVYHGSNKIRGKEILEKKEMPFSRGDSHWLGDGAYFFVEDFYAYKWIVDMFNARYTDDEDFNYERLIKKYLILKGKLNVDKERVYDLTRSEHKILFDITLKEIRNKRKAPKGKPPEGVVLNYMFEELGYIKRFDLVRALFTLNKHKYKFKNRLGYMPQEQICIKNKKVVHYIEEYNFRTKLETFNFLLNNMYYADISDQPIRKKYLPWQKKYYRNTLNKERK